MKIKLNMYKLCRSIIETEQNNVKRGIVEETKYRLGLLGTLIERNEPDNTLPACEYLVQQQQEGIKKLLCIKAPCYKTTIEIKKEDIDDFNKVFFHYIKGDYSE